MHQAASLYQKTQQQTVTPRQLEAQLLLKAAGRLEASYQGNRDDRRQALAYNRKLWTIFVSAVTQDDSPLPAQIRQNIANLGIFIFNQTISAERRDDAALIKPIVNINREIAAGLRAMPEAPQAAAV